MPLYKYKSFEEAERAMRNFEPDAESYRRSLELWKIARELAPMNMPRGVFKFRTIEEANAHRRGVELAHARKLREKRAL